jgi:hypothetical protein
METAKSISRPDCWERLAVQALKQGNHKVLFFLISLKDKLDFYIINN